MCFQLFSPFYLFRRKKKSTYERKITERKKAKTFFLFHFIFLSFFLVFFVFF